MNINASHQIGELSEVEAEAVAIRANGGTLKAAMAATGLNHSQVERAVLKATLTQADADRFEAGGADLADRVVAARNAGTSWGVIGILAGEPESKVRKAWSDRTALESKGLRIGRGGRFAYGYSGEPLYEAELRPTGTAIPKGAGLVGALKESRIQRIGRMELDDLKALGAELGIEWTKRGTKAAYAKKVAAALVAELGEEGADELTAE